METCLMIEWDTPKSEDRWKGYWEISKKSMPYMEKMKKDGVLKDFSSWSDNTGHIVFLLFFEDENKFAKLWGDKEFHSLASASTDYFDNTHVRIMRPSTTTPS